MATYNHLTAELICPRCKCKTEMQVNCYFGYTSEMKSYRVGDVYDWLPRKAVQNGGRPDYGDIKGEGYCECPKCERDLFVVVHVVADKIDKVEPDLTRAPNIPDQRLYDLRITCPTCCRISISEVHLYEAYDFGRVISDCDCLQEIHVKLETRFSPRFEVNLGSQSHTYTFETDVVHNR